MGSRDVASDVSGDMSDSGNSVMGDQMPVDREASDLAAIVDRIASNTFPIVQPSEQTCEAVSHAAETLSWDKKCEAVEIQS
jgi:hypothetical protein